MCYLCRQKKPEVSTARLPWSPFVWWILVIFSPQFLSEISSFPTQSTWCLSLKKKRFLFNNVFVYVWVCAQECRYLQKLWDLCPRAGVMGCHMPPDMSIGNRTQEEVMLLPAEPSLHSKESNTVRAALVLLDVCLPLKGGQPTRAHTLKEKLTPLCQMLSAGNIPPHLCHCQPAVDCMPTYI